MGYAGSDSATHRRRARRYRGGLARGLCRAGGAVNAEGAPPPDREPADDAVTSPPTDDLHAPELPEASWKHLVPVAAAALPGIRPAELPARLRPFARFAPTRRAKLAGSALREELATNPAFRQLVAELAQNAGTPLAQAVIAGDVPDDADPVEVAALGFLLRPPGWRELITQAAQQVQAGEVADADAARVAAAEQRAAAAEHDRAIAQREAEKLRVELAQLRAEAEDLRRRQRASAKELREATRKERKAADALSSERGRLKQAENDHAAEVRRLKAQLDDSVGALERARQGARDTRTLNEARLWLLLETVSGAAHGLRRELGMDPAPHSPADFVADEQQTPEAERAAGARARGLEADDPARLDQLLALPQCHLLVDGYNVTIGGWGDSTLEQQRNRLVRGLSGLAAQTGSEVTVVFDGADPRIGASGSPRGVRVLFSRKDQTADEVIRALARAEPDGRPVVVVSSDKEVADGTRRHGAYTLPAEALRRRLDRALVRRDADPAKLQLTTGASRL